MKHLCYYIDYPNIAAVLDEIAERIPSWVSYNPARCEIEISCREEDAAFVEHMLAPFV